LHPISRRVQIGIYMHAYLCVRSAGRPASEGAKLQGDGDALLTACILFLVPRS
jgi:hypothetical protein